MKTAPAIRFRIDFAENCNIGPGKIALLEAIHTHGSLSAAARALELSYRRAWLLLDSLNKSFREPVSVNSVGGAGGGGVTITAFGDLLIQRYHEVERLFAEVSAAPLSDIQALAKSPSKSSARRVPVTKR